MSWGGAKDSNLILHNAKKSAGIGNSTVRAAAKSLEDMGELFRGGTGRGTDYRVYWALSKDALDQVLDGASETEGSKDAA